ncbi:MAG TPA: Ig-like domain-containing protein [Candidatus Thermoplasmatota archaeon]|nr:Ig-like domain-containing protein [Candidatus Thermoplasmatota archaeon]
MTRVRTVFLAAIFLAMATLPPAASDSLDPSAFNLVNRGSVTGGVAVAGNEHRSVVAWSDLLTFPARDVLYRVNDGSGWSALRNLTRSPTNSSLPVLALSGATIHAVWLEETAPRTYELWHAISADGRNWSAHHALGLSNQDRPAFRVDGPQAHVLWTHRNNVSYARYDGSRWLPAERVAGPRGQALIEPALTLDAQGRPVAAWTHQPVLRSNEPAPIRGPESAARVEASIRTATGWQPPAEISNPHRGPATWSSLATGSDGKVHMAFTQSVSLGSIFYLTHENGEWTEPRVVEGAFGATSYPSLGVSGTVPRLAFVLRTNGSAAMLAEPRGNGWVAQQLAYSDHPTGVGFLDQAVDEGGRSHLAWTFRRPAGGIDAYFLDRARDQPVVDTTPPAVVDTLPAPGTFVNVTDPAIEVTFVEVGGVPASSVDVRVDGVRVPQPATVVGNRILARAADLSEGPHEIEVTFADAAGNVARASWTFHVDVTPPATAFSLEPSLAPQEWHRGALQLTWTGDDPGEAASGYAGVAVSLYRNGIRTFATQLAPRTHTLSELALRHAFPLEGQFVLVYAGVDAAGNQEAERNVSFRVDSVPPVSRVLPLPAHVNASELAVEVAASDPGSGVDRIELWGRDMDAREQLPGEWRLLESFRRAEGVHRLAAEDGRLWEFRSTAFDRAGNAEAAPQSATASVTIDRSPPLLRISQPAEGSTLASTANVVAEVEDALSGVVVVRFRVDGLSLGNATAAPYVASLDPREVPPGEHVIQSEAVDGAGNVATATLRIVTTGGRARDVPPPAGNPLPAMEATVAAALLALVGALSRRRFHR